jgi:hypothetical protein
MEESEMKTRTYSSRITYLKAERKKLKEQKAKSDEFSDIKAKLSARHVKLNLLQFA